MKRICVLLLFFLLPMRAVYPVSERWTGAGNLWTAGGNWTNSMVPTNAGDTASFTTNPPPPSLGVNLNGPVTLTTMNLDLATASAYIFSGGNLTFQTLTGTGSTTISVTTTNGNGDYTFQNTVPISIAQPLVITQNSSGLFAIQGVISGAGLSTSGTGVVTLTAANTHATTTISGGTLSIVNDNNLGNAGATLTISNGTLQYAPGFVSQTRPISLTGSAQLHAASGVTATVNGVISGNGSLTTGETGGVIVLTGANLYQGGTTIGAGTLRISSDANLGASTGPLNFNGGELNIITNSLTISRSGTVNGTSSITSLLPQTFSGNFSGSGSLSFSGADFTLAGTNSYTGGTFIDANTQVAGNSNSLQGNITLNGGTSLITFQQNFDGTYSGSLIGPMGSFTKQGPSALTFSGSSPAFSGDTSINEGQLIVNGSLANSPITVHPGGALGGSGIVGATTSNGLIDPGNGATIGTLTINGTLTMGMATASTQINIAPLSADRIAVLGNANILGSIQINPVPGFYGFNASYTILTSTGLAGTFLPVTSTNSSFIPTVSYSGTNAFLHILITQPFAAFPFSNQNTAAVGNNIDEIYAANQLSNDLFSVFNTFVGQSINTINEALDQMHPAPYSAFTEMQTEVNGQIISLFHRLPYLPCACNNPNRLWIEGFGNSLTMKSHGLEVGFQGNSGGLAFGYDGQITDSFVLGIGGAWSNNHLNWHDSRGHGEMNGLYGGIYFDSQVGSFYFGGTFLAGMDFYDTSRNLKFSNIDRKATANFKAADLMGQIATAYLFGSPQAFFYPYANIDYLYLHTHKFTENGAGGLNLNVFDRTDGTLRTEMGLGLQVQDRNAAETVCIAPIVSIGWVNMCPIERPKLEATFVGATIPFKVLGWDESWNLLNVSFGLSFAYRCFSTKLAYNTEFSCDSKTILYNQNGNLRLDWKW